MTTTELPTAAADEVEAAALQRHLDGPWAGVRALVRDELRRPLLRPELGLTVEEHRKRVLAQARHLGGIEELRLLFPREYGGREDLGGAITAFETLGHGDLSLLVKTGVQWGLFGGAIVHLGTRRHHERYLRQVMSLDLPGCFAMTETGHGSDVQSLRTTATYDAARGEFVIHTPDEDARKDYIGNAARDGRLAAVFAKLVTDGAPRGVHCFLVPIRRPDGTVCEGVTIDDCGPKGGLNGVDNGRLSFDRVRVSRQALLDRYGQVAEDGTYTSPIEDEGRRFFTMLGTLVQGRASVSGAALSATKTALTIAVRYGTVRRQFRTPDGAREAVLLDYGQHRRRLLPALATTYALHAAQQALVEQLHASTAVDAGGGDGGDRGHAGVAATERRRLEALVAGVKTATTWHATHTIQTCREACGGAGYLSENRLPALRADTDVFTTFEGDNTVLLQLVAKGLLTEYRDEFGSLDTLGTVRFVADQVVEALVERTAARQLWRSIAGAVRRGDDADLFDRSWQLEMFAWREQHVLAGVARRLQAGTRAGRAAFELFDEVQDHVLLAARAHVDRIVLEYFAASVEVADDPGVAALLHRVCDLHALATIEAERGWYLEHGRLDPARSKAVTAAVNDLCARLRPHAGALVEAFAVPDEALAAPIALGAEDRRQRLRLAAGTGTEPDG